MRRYTSSLLAAVLLVSVGSWAQSDYHLRDAEWRVSYDSSPTVQREGIGHICVAVSRDGDYRVVRLLNSGQTQRLRGKIQERQFQQLKKLTSDSDFRVLSGSHGGIIRQASESFGAEIVREDSTQRLQWLNADGENPFPGSVARVVNWLKRFEPKHGEAFENAEFPDVCPSGGLRLLQPSVASTVRP